MLIFRKISLKTETVSWLCDGTILTFKFHGLGKPMIPFLNLSQVSYFPETLQYEIIKEKFIQIANPIPNRSNCSAIKYPATAHIFVTFSTQLPNMCMLQIRYLDIL